MRYLLFIFVALSLSNCTFEEEDSEDDGLTNLERAQRERETHLPENSQDDVDEDENEDVEEDIEEEVVEEISSDENSQVQEQQAQQVIAESSPPISIETTSQAQIPNQPVEVLSSVEESVEVSNEPVSQEVSQTGESPQTAAASLISEDVKGVYISNTTDLNIFYVDNASDERTLIPPNECFTKSYPHQTALSRLYFSIIAHRDGVDEIVCNNCMISERVVSAYFVIEVSAVYMETRIFNHPPIIIEPGTVIFSQSESMVKQQCGIN